MTEQPQVANEEEEVNEDSIVQHITITVIARDVTGKNKESLVLIPDVKMDETIFNLKELILEIPEACHFSSCHIEAVKSSDYEASKVSKSKSKKSKKKSNLVSVVLDDNQIIGLCNELIRGDYLFVVPDKYNAQTSWDQVTRLHKIFVNPPGPVSEDVFDQQISSETKESGETEVKNEDLEQQLLTDEQKAEFRKGMVNTVIPVNISLDSFFSGEAQLTNDNPLHEHCEVDFTEQLPECVRELSISGWNPPTRQELLMGKFLYVRVHLLEDVVLHVTGSRDGFFVNASTDSIFDASESQPVSSTLTELLTKVSPKFSSAYTALLRIAAQRSRALTQTLQLSDFDVASLGNAVMAVAPNSWLASVQVDKRTYDLTRASNSLSSSIIGEHLARDWNEDFQSSVKLPCETMDERINRARTIQKVQTDFEASAKAGAMAIVEGRLKPLNPQDEPQFHVFLLNHIFFSLALAENQDGATTTYCSSNHDLQGVLSVDSILEARRYAGENVGLHTLNTVLIDYLGTRVVAQTIVPGVLAKDHQMLYGSLNNGASIACDESVDAEIAAVMKSMHNTESSVQRTDGETLVLHAHAGMKCIKGTDGFPYLLELTRSTPLDLNYYNTEDKKKPVESEEVHYIALLRHELLTQFVLSLDSEFINQRKVLAQQVVAEYRKGIFGDKEENEDLTSEQTKELEQKVMDAIQTIPEPARLELDPNMFSPYQPSPNAKSVEVVETLAEFLVKTQIPRFVRDIRNSVNVVVDGTTLFRKLHEYGINLRYLGTISSSCFENETILVGTSEAGTSIAVPPVPESTAELCEIEMVARTTKWILRKLFNQTASPGAVIVSVLNMLFSEQDSNSATSSFDEVLAVINSGSVKKSSKLQKLIGMNVKEHFGYDLKFWFNQSTRGHALPLLRRVCQLCGIRLRARHFFQFEFTIADIDGMEPTTKSSQSEFCVKDVKDAIESSSALIRNTDYSRAFEFAHQALSLTCQISGSSHPNAHSSCALMAHIFSKVGDNTRALMHQKRTLALMNRSGNLDSDDMGQALAALGGYYATQNEITKAVSCYRRAIYIFEVLAGPGSAESSVLYHRLSTVYMKVGNPTLAFSCAQEALKRCGSNKLQFAFYLRTTAQILATGGNDWPEAFQYEKSAYKIQKEIYGAQDSRTLECAKWLEMYTRESVKQLRELQK